MATAQAGWSAGCPPGAGCVVPVEPGTARRASAHRPRHLDLRPGQPRMARLVRRGPRPDRALGEPCGSSCPTRAPRPAQHPRRRGTRAPPSTSASAGPVEVRCVSLRGQVVERPVGIRWSTTATTPTRCPCRPPLSHLLQAPAEGRVAVLGTIAELGGGSAAFPPRGRARRAAISGSSILVNGRRGPGPWLSRGLRASRRTP